MIDFSKGEVYEYPYPYIVVENCFDEKTLNNLINEFPDVSAEGAVMGGRKKMNVASHNTQRTPKFEPWIQQSPTWEKFYQWMLDDATFKSRMEYYKDHLAYWDSNITEDSSLYTDCLLHMDWSSATDGYVREIHRDTDKRIWNFLIFFNDKDWEGGDFNIHSSDNLKDWEGGDDGTLPSSASPNGILSSYLPLYQTIEAKKNLGLFFLSTPDSYHSVSQQFNTKSSRKFIYGSYSYRNGDVFNKITK